MTFSKTFALHLFFFSSAAAFRPATMKSRTTTSLSVSVVSEMIKKNQFNDAASKKLLDAFETQTPESVGIGKDIVQRKHNSNKKRRHNFKQQETFLKAEPDLDFYTLHSSAVSHLTKDMPINDILRAIKRAQNLHDAHDLHTIGAFLMDECDEQWGYGFRGSLLSRLAVAALHLSELDMALDAIETRRVYERQAMQPHESAAIVRGLMRNGKVDEAWDVLEDELRLPMDGLALEDNKEVLTHRARALASIASRFFFEGQPDVAAKALQELGFLGATITEAHMTDGELNMPWTRLVAAAEECNQKVAEDDLEELVWDAMMKFPCPGGAEECSLDDFFVTA